MAYIRKTTDQWDTEQNFGFGHGWEVVSCDDNLLDARQTLKDYRMNQPEYPSRLVKKRVKLTETEN